MGIVIYETPPFGRLEEERERAVEASGALAATGDPVLQSLVEEASRSFKSEMAAVVIVHLDWVYVLAATGLPTGPYSRRSSFCGHAIYYPDKVFCVSDAANDERFTGDPAVSSNGLVRFYAGANLLDQKGYALGTICVFDPKPRECLPAGDDLKLIELAQTAMDRIVDRRRA